MKPCGRVSTHKCTYIYIDTQTHTHTPTHRHTHTHTLNAVPTHNASAFQLAQAAHQWGCLVINWDYRVMSARCVLILLLHLFYPTVREGGEGRAEMVVRLQAEDQSWVWLYMVLQLEAGGDSPISSNNYIIR